jgi:hypothetical protein
MMAAAALALALCAARAEAEPLAAEPERVQPERLAGGNHWRFTVERAGVVHVWTPRGYDPHTAGAVLYVHGYFTDADESWRLHNLAEQFRASRRNALFVVPEAPVGGGDRVRWDDPRKLLAAVRSHCGELAMPAGPLVAMGHSGGFRTLAAWLEAPRLEEVILIDGLYWNEQDFAAWLQGESGGRRRHLVMVGFETSERAEQFLLAGFGDALVRDAIPERGIDFRRREREARVVYLRSQYGHMELVTEGRVIPVLLALTALRPL